MVTGRARRQARQNLDAGNKPLAGRMVSKRPMGNFLQALVAVLAGNAAYFLLMPHLPASARHAAFHIDLGLAIDFWFCLVALGVIKTVVWRRRQAEERER